MTFNHRITRRSALQGIAAWIGTARFAHAAESSTVGRFVEKQPNGAEIFQVTTEEFDQSDIYGEVPYCSRDSRYFVYARRNPALKTNRTEFMLVELGTWKQQRLDTAISISGCAISHDGVFYYLKQSDDGSTDLMRADLENGKVTSIYRLPPGLAIRSLGTVTTDGRYYAGGTMTEPGWKMFDITLIDLQKGEHRILDRDPFKRWSWDCCLRGQLDHQPTSRSQRRPSVLATDWRGTMNSKATSWIRGDGRIASIPVSGACNLPKMSRWPTVACIWP